MLWVYVLMPIHSTCTFRYFLMRYGFGVCPMLNYYLYVVPKNEFLDQCNGKIVNLQTG